MTAMRFFVYGSMSEGMVHFDKIKDFMISSQPAQIKATCFRLRVGFPALINEPQDFVPGQLVELKNSEVLLSLLDEFFGYNRFEEQNSLHIRVNTPVFINENEELLAWTYFLQKNKLPKEAELIEGGNWASLLSPDNLLTHKLSEKQRAYVLKLGKCSGRDIVPIDLPLYRELMNLQLIVDKGRRLALSKLGQEVYRYLG